MAQGCIDIGLVTIEAENRRDCIWNRAIGRRFISTGRCRCDPRWINHYPHSAASFSCDEVYRRWIFKLHPLALPDVPGERLWTTRIFRNIANSTRPSLELRALTLFYLNPRQISLRDAVKPHQARLCTKTEGERLPMIASDIRECWVRLGGTRAG